nr:DEAD/DEAH box helicase [Paenibacillus dauci]
MQVALYTIKHAREWSIHISLDLRVDLVWWTALTKREQRSEQIWLISTGIPLGWALQCCSYLITLDRTSMRQNTWGDYIHRALMDVYHNSLVSGKSNSDQNHQSTHGTWDLLWDVYNSWTAAGYYILSSWEEDQLQGDPGSSLWKRQLTHEASYISKALSGRSLLWNECIAMMQDSDYVEHSLKSSLQLAYLNQQISLLSAVYKPARPKPKRPLPFRTAASRAAEVRCRRCGSHHIRYTSCASCGSAACGYCEDCLTLGRSRECGLLLQGNFSDLGDMQPVHVHDDALPTASNTLRRVSNPSYIEAYNPEVIRQRWGLSPAQTAAAYQALLFLAKSVFAACNQNTASTRKLSAARNTASSLNKERFLLWAVTGAGKTEMVFPLLEHAIRTGGRAVIATPRRDVVLELAPRLAKAFPDIDIAVLYGGSEDRWKKAALTISTTHQLMRFHEAFELVIIDEIDAFPYHNNPMLSYAANQACRPNGKFIYLSATPSADLQQEIKRGTLAHAKVPVRYHRHPLPVPKHLKVPSLSRCITNKHLPNSLQSQIHQSINRGAQIFLFVPRIAWIEATIELIRKYFPHIHIEGTSSQDHDRAEKVSLFRQQQIRLLVTTTILERGVTIPKSDVYIMDANDKLYDSAALIQMAGRAGRSMDDPAGGVFFASRDWTLEQKRAVNQIKQMNRTARRQGYLQ